MRNRTNVSSLRVCTFPLVLSFLFSGRFSLQHVLLQASLFCRRLDSARITDERTCTCASALR